MSGLVGMGHDRRDRTEPGIGDGGGFPPVAGVMGERKQRQAASPALFWMWLEREVPRGYLVRGHIPRDVDIDIEFVVIIVVVEQGDPGKAGVVLLAEPDRQVGIVIG